VRPGVAAGRGSRSGTAWPREEEGRWEKREKENGEKGKEKEERKKENRKKENRGRKIEKGF
jgi:hypothetical protein